MTLAIERKLTVYAACGISGSSAFIVFEPLSEPRRGWEIRWISRAAQ